MWFFWYQKKKKKKKKKNKEQKTNYTLSCIRKKTLKKRILWQHGILTIGTGLLGSASLTLIMWLRIVFKSWNVESDTMLYTKAKPWPFFMYKSLIAVNCSCCVVMIKLLGKGNEWVKQLRTVPAVSRISSMYDLPSTSTCLRYDSSMVGSYCLHDYSLVLIVTIPHPHTHLTHTHNSHVNNTVMRTNYQTEKNGEIITKLCWNPTSRYYPTHR